MGTLLFRLSQVPTDEAQDIRQLLEDNDIDYYETHAGFFGTSVAGLWLERKDQQERARTLLSQYQQERLQRVRADYECRLAAGEVENLWQRIKRQPLKVLLCLVAVVIILYFSIMPFMRMNPS